MMPAQRLAWALAGGALLLLCLAFTPEIGSAVGTWNASTAYGHCWLVLPIAGWLLWERRAVVQAGVPVPVMWPALVAIPLVLGWLAANWLGIMEGRQLALVGLAELVLMAALGWRLWWALSPGFLYLVFLVPFGAFITPSLQHFTANFIIAGLHALDVPVEADTFQITIPEGVFYVAEACAGLRFLIASIAFGVLYAVTIFRSPWRRAAFIAVSCVVPVVANGVRGLGIVLLGHILGSAEAGAADHLIYGWVFFSFVIVVLALAGLPFRQDQVAAVPARSVSGVAPRLWRLVAACVAVLVVAGLGKLAVRLLDARAGVVLQAVMPAVVVPAGCHGAGVKVKGAVSTQSFLCQSGMLRVIATAIPAGANPSRILEVARGPASRGLEGNVDMQPWRTPSGDAWMLVIAHDSSRQSAFTSIVGHRHLLSGLGDRIRMARAMTSGAPSLAVAMTYESEAADAMAQLQGFISAQPVW